MWAQITLKHPVCDHWHSPSISVRYKTADSSFENFNQRSQILIPVSFVSVMIHIQCYHRNQFLSVLLISVFVELITCLTKVADDSSKGDFYNLLYAELFEWNAQMFFTTEMAQVIRIDMFSSWKDRNWSLYIDTMAAEGHFHINSVGPRGIWLQSQISKFQTHFNDKYIKYFLWNCHQVSATTHHWSLVNIGSGNGLVLSGNKPLPEPMLT